MKFVYSPQYCVDLRGHIFPTEKYRLIYETLKKEGLITESNLYEPQMPHVDDLRKILTPEYLDDLLNNRITFRTWRSELPVEPDIIKWQMLGCSGSYLAGKLALEGGACYHIGGGLHHAFADHAEGFCYLNDVVFAAVKLLEDGVKKIAIIDCDLHQGNGTAKFFQNEERVFTFSIHQEHLYPVKEKSDLDIGLDFNVGDEEYLEKLNSALKKIFTDFKPEFVIYLAGADPYMYDQLGNLRLSIEGLIKRDEMVITYSRKNSLPIIITLAGGYALELEDTVEIHCNTARVLYKIYG
ncbi:MAG: histone deacetylase [candidate division WOR-3 bacterium]|nr:histone deacetylase [candidate division WOR-3 bacterium]